MTINVSKPPFVMNNWIVSSDISLGLAEYCAANIIVTELTCNCFQNMSRPCSSVCAAWITVEGDGHDRVIGYCGDVYGLNPLQNVLAERAANESK